MKFQKLVTKEWLAAKVQINASHVIGRAIVAIYNEQTAEEKSSRTTKIYNGCGFSKPDANLGTRTAKTFIETGTLETWQVKVWMQPNKKGLPRIVKYTAQLNQIANRKLLHVPYYGSENGNDYFKL